MSPRNERSIVSKKTTSAADRVDAQNAGHSDAPMTHPEFDRLVRTIWRLRQPDGCPWDREQTHRSITKNMIEEAYEAVDAIEAGDTGHLLEELGDVLEQVLLHAQISSDDGVFDIDDVARELNEKLVRRHPHVFGDLAAAANGDEVMDIWDDVKRAERAAAGEGDAPEPGILDSVPHSLPALMQAQKISKRAAKAGFEWETVDDVWDKVAEERVEFEREEPGTDARSLEFGDLLFALVNVARREGIDAEEALAASNRKFRARWSCMEELARQGRRELDSLDTNELNVLWERAKQEEMA
jgi:tetrapyrrole methylase family protein/MazG family protein